MKKEINDKAQELGLKYFPNEQNIWARENIEAIYCSGACIDMAEWMQKKMINKACKILENVIVTYDKRFFGKCEENAFDADFIKAFRQAMEE